MSKSNVPELISETLISMYNTYDIVKHKIMNNNGELSFNVLERKLKEVDITPNYLTKTFDIPKFIEGLSFIDEKDGLVKPFDDEYLNKNLAALSTEEQVKLYIDKLPSYNRNYPLVQEYLATIDISRLNYFSKGTLRLGEKNELSIFTRDLKKRVSMIDNIHNSKYVANNVYYFGPVSLDAIAKDYFKGILINLRKKNDS